MFDRSKKVLGALLAIAMLVGCSNDDEAARSKGALLSGLKNSFAKSRAEPQLEISEAALQQLLQSTATPLVLVTSVDNKPQAVLAEIESNGDYRTFGAPDRTSVTFLHGMVAASRGLGNDLMSAEIGESLALVRARRAGEAQRIHRFLGGEDQTRQLVFQCSVSRGSSARVVIGQIDEAGIQMTEACTGENRNFSNVYVVNSAGRILSSQQWMSPTRGNLAFHDLR